MESKSQVKAVLFDLGGTLVKTDVISYVMKRILEDCGVDRSLEETSARQKCRDDEISQGTADD